MPSSLGGDPIQSMADTWTYSDEFHLLRSVLEITAEPVKAFDPTISLFNRIEKHLKKGAFSRAEILAKVKELRKRYDNGGDLGGNGELVEICEKIWGIGRKRKGLNKKKIRKKRKKKKKVHINKLLSDGSRQLNNDLHPQKHFSAIVSSSWAERHRLGCCQNLQSSQNGFCLSSSDSCFFSKSSLKLTENIDRMKLRQSSKLVLTALNDASHQHQEEPIDKLSLTVAQPFNNGLVNSLSHEPESPPHDEEPYKQKLLAESSCKIAEKRFRLALQACTGGKGAVWASSAFFASNDVTYQSGQNSESLSMNEFVSSPFVDEYPESVCMNEFVSSPFVDEYPESMCMNEFVSSPFVDEYPKTKRLETLNDMHAEEFDPLAV